MRQCLSLIEPSQNFDVRFFIGLLKLSIKLIDLIRYFFNLTELMQALILLFLENLADMCLESLLSLHEQVSDVVVEDAQVFAVCLCLMPHQLNLSVDLILARNQLLLTSHSVLLLIF